MHLLITFIMVVVTLWFNFKPPTKINSYYGYRTTRSMINQNTWVAANNYSGNLMLIIIGVFVTGQYALIKQVGGKKSLFYAGVLLIILLLAVMTLTESYLKRHFDEEGNRIEKIDPMNN